MIVAGFYTYGYRKHAERLRKDLKVHSIRYVLRWARDLGNHNANVHQKPAHIAAVLHAHHEPVLYVDVDARVRGRLDLFDGDIPPYDVGAHFWKVEGGVNPEVLLGGTLFFGYTSYALRCLGEWLMENAAHPEKTDQENLQAALGRFDRYRVLRLPASYCWIEPAMRPFLPETEPVIEQLAVSRPKGVAK